MEVEYGPVAQPTATQYDPDYHVWEVGHIGSNGGIFFCPLGSPKFKFRWEAEAYLRSIEGNEEIV